MEKGIARTTRFVRTRLPHWEVEGGRYFVTVRCADSLPAAVVARLSEIQFTLSKVEPRSEEMVAMQRQYFRTMEKYLDAGAGSCPLGNPDMARAVIEELISLGREGIDVPHFTIMPNHWHALICPMTESWCGLSAMMKRVKGRTGRTIRQMLGGAGPIWQREWFDRWMRNDSEWDRCVDYIRNNPVKAGLVSEWREHPWTK